jgi:hypothetical protein
VASRVDHGAGSNRFEEYVTISIPVRRLAVQVVDRSMAEVIKFRVFKLLFEPVLVDLQRGDVIMYLWHTTVGR